MSARTPSQPVHPAPSPIRGRAPLSFTLAGLSPQLRGALGVGVLGGLALAIGPLLPVVTPNTSPGFAAGPLLFVLGLLPVAVAVGFAVTGRRAAAGGALIAAAMFAIGRGLVDAQLAVEGSAATRPELAMPTELRHLHGATGLWLLLAGHALTLAAGLLALADRDDADPAVSATTVRRPGSVPGVAALALAIGVVAALGLTSAPYVSDTAFLLGPGTLDAPPIVLTGGVLIALAALLAAVLGVTGTERAASRGWLLGTAASVTAIALPRLVGGLATPHLHLAPGPVLAVVAAVALAVLAVAGGGGEPAGEPAADVAEPADVTLPGESRLLRAAAALGVVAAVAALFGAGTELFAVPANLPQLGSGAGRLLWPAAVLVGACAAGLASPRWAPVLRPAFSVVWVGIPLAGVLALDTAMTATQIDGIGLGFGAWAALLAILLAVAAACCAGLAGGVEREDVDTTELPWQPVVAAPAAAGALLAIGAFGLPVVTAPDYRAAGLWSDFRFASWGLAIAVVAVVVAAVLAPRSRPVRGAALLFGAAALAVLRLLEFPLGVDQAPGSTAGPGVLLSAACAVALLVAGGLAVRQARSSADRPQRPVAAARRPSG